MGVEQEKGYFRSYSLIIAEPMISTAPMMPSHVIPSFKITAETTIATIGSM